MVARLLPPYSPSLSLSQRHIQSHILNIRYDADTHFVTFSSVGPTERDEPTTRSCLVTSSPRGLSTPNSSLDECQDAIQSAGEQLPSQRGTTISREQ